MKKALLFLAVSAAVVACGKKATEWNADTEKSYLEACKKEGQGISEEVCQCRLATLKEDKVTPDKANDLGNTMKVSVKCAFASVGDAMKDAVNAIDTSLKHAADSLNKATHTTTTGGH